MRGGFSGRGGFGYGGSGASFAGPPPTGAPGTQLYIGNIPFQAGWQDLKDLFRSAGNVVRADLNFGPDGRPKGSGIVVFASPEDAQNAIAQYNGFDWSGRQIEVREDRFAGNTDGGYGGYSGYGSQYNGASFGYGAPRGGYGGFGGRGGHRGGYGGGFGGRQGFSGAQSNLPPAEPSQQIFVKNVSRQSRDWTFLKLCTTASMVNV